MPLPTLQQLASCIPENSTVTTCIDTILAFKEQFMHHFYEKAVYFIICGLYVTLTSCVTACMPWRWRVELF